MWVRLGLHVLDRVSDTDGDTMERGAVGGRKVFSIWGNSSDICQLGNSLLCFRERLSLWFEAGSVSEPVRRASASNRTGPAGFLEVFWPLRGSAPCGANWRQPSHLGLKWRDSQISLHLFVINPLSVSSFRVKFTQKYSTAISYSSACLHYGCTPTHTHTHARTHTKRKTNNCPTVTQLMNTANQSFAYT